MQYLYNISKKKLGREFIFYMQMNKVGNIFAKSVAAVFVFYCDAKHSDIVRGPAMFIVIYLFHSQTRCFMPKHHNAIIKHHLCGEGLPSLLSLLQVDVFQ